MLRPEWFHRRLAARGVDFYTGVPDTVLKSLCSYLVDAVPPPGHVTAANEGGAVGLAAGHYLATGRPALVYMQNSGIGNAANPLLSLVDRDVYAIPMLLAIGWRGEPGVKDEPQHLKQGRLTTPILDCLEIPWGVLDGDEGGAEAELDKAFASFKRSPGPYAFVIRNKAFAPYAPRSGQTAAAPADMTREAALAVVREACGDRAALLGSTGMGARELFEIGDRAGGDVKRLFLNVGAMGHCSQIAAAVALARPERPVVCLDGDGALFMHLGVLPVISGLRPRNLLHVALNNGIHESVGGQPTPLPDLSLAGLASASGYPLVRRAESMDGLRRALAEWNGTNGPFFLEVLIRPGFRADLGRPTWMPVQAKEAFMGFLAGM